MITWSLGLIIMAASSTKTQHTCKKHVFSSQHAKQHNGWCERTVRRDCCWLERPKYNNQYNNCRAHTSLLLNYKECNQQYNITLLTKCVQHRATLSTLPLPAYTGQWAYQTVNAPCTCQVESTQRLDLTSGGQTMDTGGGVLSYIDKPNWLHRSVASWVITPLVRHTALVQLTL